MGTTVLRELTSAGPLILRRTGGPGPTAGVHLVGGAAGPLGGDHWRLDVIVGPGARLRLRSVGATLALPDRTGAECVIEVNAQVAPGGFLDYACEPVVVAAGARLRSCARVDLAANSGLCWREEVVTGRSGERSGDAEFSLRVDCDGTPLLAQDLTVGPRQPWWSSAAVLGDARAFGTLLVAGPFAKEGLAPGVLSREAGSVCVLAALAGPGFLATATGWDVSAVRRALDRVDGRCVSCPADG
jgi:urease accessory protein